MLTEQLPTTNMKRFCPSLVPGTGNYQHWVRASRGVVITPLLFLNTRQVGGAGTGFPVQFKASSLGWSTSTTATAYVGYQCDTTTRSGLKARDPGTGVSAVNSVTEAVDVTYQADTGLWKFNLLTPVDLDAFRYYHVCLDADGTTNTLAFQETGVMIFSTSAIESQTVKTDTGVSIKQASAQKVTILCTRGICNQGTTMGYLVMDPGPAIDTDRQVRVIFVRILYLVNLLSNEQKDSLDSSPSYVSPLLCPHIYSC